MKPLARRTLFTEQKSDARRLNSLERRVVVNGAFEIKVFADDETVLIGNGAFYFAIPIDLDTAELRSVGAFVSTVSSGGGPLLVMIHNLTQGIDMLSSAISIPDGDFTSTDWGQSTGVNFANNQVQSEDMIRIDVDDPGTGAKGLGVVLGFA